MATNLTRRGANANSAALLPALPDSQRVTDPVVRSQLELIREWLEVRLGARGDRWERAVTFRDLDPLLAALERRIAALEAAAGITPAPTNDRRLQFLSARLDELFLQQRLDYDFSITQIMNITNRVRDVAVEDVVVYARDMRPSVTAGCSALTTIEFDPAQPNFHALLFDPTADESADFSVMLPFSWAGRKFRVYVYWGHGAGGTAFGTTWEVTANSTSDNETVILDFVGGAVITDTGGTSGNLYIAAFSDPIPVASNINRNGDLVSVRIYRRPTHVDDDLDIDAALLAVRFTLSDVPFPDPSYDPYWANVVLLVQDGADGTYVVQDHSSYGDSVTITNYAEWDSAEQLFGVNTIKETTLSPAIPGFTSSGYTSRFGRATGDLYTFECWLYVNVTENYSVSAIVFSWWHGTSDRIFELTTYANSTNLALRIRNGDDTSIETELLTSNEWHFVQVNFDGSDYTVDLNGVEVYSGTNSYGVNVAGDFRVQVASQTAAGSSTAPTTQVWVTPFRVTKGVLRTRGVVPTALFPTA